jgi:hypothetical protein
MDDEKIVTPTDAANTTVAPAANQTPNATACACGKKHKKNKK